MQTELLNLRATVDPGGTVHLLQPIKLERTARAIVTILPEDADETALLSEASLGEDWNRPEEDEAWAHLQPGR
jgi:hypothetical protein